MIRKQRVTAAQESTSLHYPNLETMPENQPDAEVENNQKWNTLIAPDNVEGGAGKESTSLHTPNADPSPAPEVPTKEKIGAAQRLKAGLEDDAADTPMDLPELAQDPDAPDAGDDENQDFGADETGGPGTVATASKKAVVAKKKVKAADEAGGPVGPAGNAQEEDCDDNDLANIDNEVDPAEGYLPTKQAVGQDALPIGANADEEDDFTGDEEEDGEHELNAFDFGGDEGDTELEHGDNPQSILEANEGEDEDWDAPAEDAFEVEEDEAEEEPLGLAEEVDEVENEPADNPLEAGDVMDLVDVDGTEDDADDIAFATMASARGNDVVHVIHKNRIIASMTKKAAVKAGADDVYTGAQFQDVVAAEVASHGLRKGLTSMGFVMAKVNVAASTTENKRVKAKVNKLTAAVRAAEANRQQSFEQCMAIAAVGINRSYFKGYKNELKAALTENLENMGVRGASRLVAHVFQEQGVVLAKQIVELANRLVAMPEATRNAFADALDMTEDNLDEPGGFEGGDEFGMEAEAEDDGFTDEFVDNIEAPNTIEAALSRPAMRLQASIAESNSRSALLNPQKVKLSAAAQALLSGNNTFKLG
ncbi:hypothetical protein [Burkholderia phage BCSR5]|nr:hypothetical protein [Burkholderia phage BCSR5]